MDPIAELLSQLSGTRRAAGHTSTASQLQQLQIMQLQLERQQQQQSQQGTARQQVERLAVPRRQTNAATAASAAAAASSNSNPGHGASSSSLGVAESTMSSTSLQKDSQFLLSRIQEPVLTETEQQSLEVENADRSFFLQDLILSTLNDEYYNEEPDDLVIEGAIGGTIEFEPAETLLQLESLHIKDKERPA